MRLYCRTVFCGASRPRHQQARRVELISNRYQLRKSQIEQMVTDEERLYELIPRLMINFKYAIVCEELKHTLFALQNPTIANDETQCNSIMERYNEIEQSKKHHGKATGRQSHPEFLNSIRRVFHQELCLIKFINSSRVFAWLNAPVNRM